MSLQCAAKKGLNLLWICEFRFKCIVCLLSVWFSFCGRFFGTYWHFVLWKLSANLLHCFTANEKPNYDIRPLGQLNHPTPRMTKKWLCCILPQHVPWAPLHPTISPSLKRKRICYHFILFKIVCHFSMVTSQKHHYTNKPTAQYSFIIAYVAILMASEGIYIFVLVNKIKRPFKFKLSFLHHCQ